MNIDRFFNILFDEGEFTCFQKFPKGTKVHPVSNYNSVKNWAQNFTINPLDGHMDHMPLIDTHHKNKPRRADCNVVVFRSFMFEIDSIPLKQQWEMIQESKVPFSTAVYSGGKSIHFIITLKTPCKDRKEYDKIYKYFYKAFESLYPNIIDTQNKNPSRASRFPGITRLETGKSQTLITIKERVDKSELISWIEKVTGPLQDTHEYNEFSQQIIPNKSRSLSGRTQNILMFGVDKGERNLSAFKAACDFARCGYDKFDAIEKLSKSIDLPLNEIKSAVTSAYIRVQKAL